MWGGGASRWALSLIAVVAIALPASASAALEPGTPVQPSPGVPAHGRAWELVTSPDPTSTELLGIRALAHSGNGLVYQTLGPTPGAVNGAPVFFSTRAVRGPDGWVSSPVPAPYPLEADIFSGIPNAFDPEVGNSLWQANLPLEAGETEPGSALFRGFPDGTLTQLVGIYRGSIAGASSDLGHVIFTTQEPLLPGDAGGETDALYELAGSTLRLVAVDESGSPIDPCGGSFDFGTNTVSRDGRRIFFGLNANCAGAVVLLREDGVRTVDVSAPQCEIETCPAIGGADLLGASPDGSQVYFVSYIRLLDEDLDLERDLYRYDVATGSLHLIVPPGGPDVAPTGGSAALSDDGRRIYFSAYDSADGFEAAYVADPQAVRRLPDKGRVPENISADGRFALILSNEQLGDGDSDESVDLYRYDAVDGSVARLSAGPSGGNGPFDVDLGSGILSAAAGNPLWKLSEDGSRAFFNTAERLVPEDRNEVSDAYEWANGRLSLISAGTPGLDAGSILGGSGDGRTVLFETSATLLPRDRDGGDEDIYAARIGGGFAEPPLAPECGSGCRNGAGSALGRPAPASAGDSDRIRLRRFDAAARRAIAASGWITVLAEAPRAGRLSAKGTARLGGRSRTVAGKRVEVAAAGPARLRMRLSAPARRRLAVGGDLRLRLSVALSGLESRATAKLLLRGGR